MDVRNIDLDRPVTREQWDILSSTARERGPVEGFRVSDADPPEVIVVASLERAPEEWGEWLSSRFEYGHPYKDAARLVFNDGTPYARLEPWAAPDGGDDPERQTRMDAAFERWVRSRWHALLRLSGIQYVRGRVPRS
jgi:hypothetical protein